MKFISFVLFSSLVSTGAFAQMNQNHVVASGTLLNLLKLPEEIFWAINRPLMVKQHKEESLLTRQDHSYSEESLSCEEKCYDDFRILADKSKRMRPDTGEHLLSFLNEKSDFANHIQRTVGYCWGHSSITRNFNYLAYFDPSAEKLETKKYRKIIKKIAGGRAAVIPGFPNLREFSADPEIQVLLKDRVVSKWVSNSLRLSSAYVSFRGFKGLMKPNKLNKFLDEVRFRLSVNHVPKIFFTNLKKPGFIHIVSVYDIVEEENQYKLCILDNHEYEDDLRNCGVFVSIKKDGSENFYAGWETPEKNREGYVGQFGFTPEDRSEMMRYRKENTKMCLKLCQGM